MLKWLRSNACNLVLKKYGSHRLVFSPYDASHLRDILIERAEKGLKEGTYDDAVVPLCAAYGAREHGDARRTVELLGKAASIAEKEGSPRIQEKHVNKAREVIEFREEIMANIQDRLFETYDFEHTDINLDWTSLVLFGDKCKLGKYGYSRDHRPDKKQITIGVSELNRLMCQSDSQ